MIFGVLLGLCAACTLCGAVWWIVRVRRIRAQFGRDEQGRPIPGSDWPPLVDYLFHGFLGRNINAPYGEFELSFPLGFPVVFISEPKLIKHIMTGASVKDYSKVCFTLSLTHSLSLSLSLS